MWQHNLKQVVRSLWRHKAFTFINLAGLSVGIAAVLVIALIVDYEQGFDQLHSGDAHLYRVVTRSSQAGNDSYEAAVPYPTGRLLRAELSSVRATQLHYSDDMNVRVGRREPFKEHNLLFADSLFFGVMDFARVPGFWLSGNPATALMAPNKAVLTESTARRYFGDANPLGQLIRLENKADVEVVGVVRDLPAATHLPFSMVISFSTLNSDFMNGLDLDTWGFVSGGYSYVRLKEETEVAAVNRALHTIVQRNGNEERDRRTQMYLQPVRKIHFDPRFADSNPSYTVSPRYLRLLLLLGGIILLIACVNYVNLSTSMAFNRSREVGIRKTIGASRRQLFGFYMLETVLLTTLAALIGLLIALAVLPYLNGLLEKSVSPLRLLQPAFAGAIVLAILLISLLSGSYPALVLAGFRPVFALRSQQATPGRTSTLLRKGLVVFQFTTTIVLIIGTIVIARQMSFLHNKSLGFNKESVVEVRLPVSDSAQIERFRSRLQTVPGIRSVSFCLGAPISESGISVSLQAPELPATANYDIKILPADQAYLQTYGLELLAGRWFLPAEEKNRGSGLVVNETLVKTLGYRHPAEAIGKKVRIGVNNYNPPIIGVTRDFHTSSLHEPISPVGMMPFDPFYYAAGIRMEPGRMKATLAGIEQAWKGVFPESVYQINFVDETLAKSYQQEGRAYQLFRAFALISIFICCIGLWGLIAFVVARKTKEIGIRKVLGASASGIVLLLSKDFLRLVGIALLVAAPVAWYLMDRWLQDFAYRVDISWWMFALAGLLVVLVALFTISFQAVKAALANPVRNLRSE